MDRVPPSRRIEESVLSRREEAELDSLAIDAGPAPTQKAARSELNRFLGRVRARARAFAALSALLLLAQIVLLVALLGVAPGLPATSALRSGYLYFAAGALLLAMLVAVRMALRPLSDLDLATRVGVGAGSAALGDALRTSVELGNASTPAPGISPHLVARHLEVTSRALREVDPAAIERARVLWPPVRRLGLLLALAAATAWFAPGAWSAWYAGLFSGPRAPLASVHPDSRAATGGFQAVLANLTLVYRYPAYTGLPSRQIEGAVGDLRALRGTEVEIHATTDRRVRAGRLRLEPGEPVPLEVEADGRRVLARIILHSDGLWQAELDDDSGGTALDPARHAIAVDLDSPPTAAMEQPAADLEVDELAVVDLAWLASDDYGLTEVVLVVEHAGRKTRRVLPVQPSSGDLHESRGRDKLALKPLALSAGEEVAVWLEVKDNDTVSGPKLTTSVARRLRVKAVSTRHDAFVAILAQLLEDMVSTLDSALTATPPGAHNVRAAAETEDALARRMGEHRGRLDEALRALWENPLGSEKTFNELGAMALRLKALEEEALSTLRREAPALARPLGDPSLVRALSDLRARDVTEMETDVLALDDIVRREKAVVLKELARKIAEDERTLAALLEEYRRTGSSATMDEINRLLSKMKALMAEFEQRMASSERGESEEFVNLDAIREQIDAARSGSMAELEKKIAQGDLDSASRQAAEMAQKLARAAASLENAAPMGALGQQRAANDLARVIERVEALRDAEARMVESTDSLRREEQVRNFGKGRDAGQLFQREAERAATVSREAAAAAALLEQDGSVQTQAERKRRMDELSREGAERLARGADPSELDDLREELFKLRAAAEDPEARGRLEARERLAQAAKQAAEVAQALSSRSLAEGLDAAHAMQRRLQEAGRRLNAAPSDSDEGGGEGQSPERASGTSGPGEAGSSPAAGTRRAESEADELVRNLEAMQRLLKQDPTVSTSARDGARMSEMARKQRSLRAEASEVRGETERIAEETPQLPPDLGENLGQAADYMDLAARGLDAREVGDGHRNSVAATERLEEALRALEQAQQQCNKGGGTGGSGSGSSAMAYLPSGVQGPPRFGGRREEGRSESGGREGTEGGAGPEKVAIPTADQALAPEAFRKDVLEGMKESRPSGWEERLEQYYKRLVR